MEKHKKDMPQPDVVKTASGWPADPEERKREALRRQAKARLNKSLALKPKPKVSLGSAVLDPAVASALAAYRKLPRLERAPWRKARRLNSDQLSKITHGLATPNVVARVLSVNGNQQLAVRDQRLARIPDPISLIPDSTPQPASLPAGFFDGVIEAFEVKQDHMREFIDQLKRMRSGSTRV